MEHKQTAIESKGVEIERQLREKVRVFLSWPKYITAPHMLIIGSRNG